MRLFRACLFIAMASLCSPPLTATASDPGAALERRVVPNKPSRTRLTQHVQRDTIVLKLREGTQIRLRGRNLRSLAGHDMSALQEVLKSIPGLTIQRLFLRAEQDLEQDRLTGQARSGRELADLSLYYLLKIAVAIPDADIEHFINALNALDLVEIAYPEPVARPAAIDIPPTTPDFELQQVYLDPAPTGVDARYAWDFPGGRGETMRFIDVEAGWQLTHEDLKPPFFEAGTQLTSGGWVNHGTAVLGQLIGDENGFGISGIAPQAGYGVSSIGGQSTATAINTAAAQLDPGDVILIELHSKGPVTGDACPCNCGQFEYVGMEYWQANYDAIAAATANGIVVVEVAGNGSVNLDHAVYAGAFNRLVRDSGAILVGASAATERVPTCWTNHGTRIDVHGWGASVVSTGYGDLFNGGDADQLYTSTFSGTSSASPIVAGSILAVQGYNRQQGAVLSPADVRTVLSNTGTVQASHVKRIGPLPDLQRAFITDASDVDQDALLDVFETNSGVFISAWDTGTDPALADTDGDGISDGLEVLNFGLDPLDPDGDSDGMPDGFEARYGLDTDVDDSALDGDSDGLSNTQEFSYGTNPTNPDSDGDTLNDGDEISMYGTNALAADSDNDGMRDDFEVLNGLDPLVDDSALDADSDELDNLGEFNAGTDPQNPDSDADGLSDGGEVITYGTDPLNGDSDLDGLTDGEEVTQFGTNPLSNTDSDRDGMPDDWEQARGTDPALDDARLDTDADGVDNIVEKIRGTLPGDPVSTPAINAIHVDPANNSGLEDGSISNPFSTLGEAIDAAQAGDTIVLASGTHAIGALFLDKEVQFTGPADRSATVSGTYVLIQNIRWGGFSSLRLEVAGVNMSNTRNLLFDNSRLLPGERFRAYQGSKVLFRNDLILNPGTATEAIWVDNDSHVELVNDTIVGFPVGLRFEYYSGTPGIDGSAEIRNSILVNTDDLAGIASSLMVSDSVIGESGFSGIDGNISGDPLFVDAATGDYHLQSASPAVDAGDIAATYGNEPEPNGCRINMGAYGNSAEATTSIDDPDADGVFGYCEARRGTDPLLADTDGDGLTDGDGGFVPLASLPAGVDSDSDGFVDGEQDVGTDPLLRDTDGDGLDDGQEVAGNSNPLDPGSWPNLADGDLAPRGAPDGLVNAGDMVAGQRLALGLETATALELAHGDLYPPGAPDGVFNLQDLLLLQQQIFH